MCRGLKTTMIQEFSFYINDISETIEHGRQFIGGTLHEATAMDYLLEGIILREAVACIHKDNIVA
jgi:hypothetical protein